MNRHSQCIQIRISPIADCIFFFLARRRLGLTYTGVHVCLSLGYFIDTAQANIHKGKDPKEYLYSIAENEIEPTCRYRRLLKLAFTHIGIFPGKWDPKQSIECLEKYLPLVPYLLSKDDTESGYLGTTRKSESTIPYSVLLSDPLLQIFTRYIFTCFVSSELQMNLLLFVHPHYKFTSIWTLYHPRRKYIITSKNAGVRMGFLVRC